MATPAVRLTAALRILRNSSGPVPMNRGSYPLASAIAPTHKNGRVTVRAKYSAGMPPWESKRISSAISPAIRAQTESSRAAVRR
jgi:hypothetical protein